MMDHQVQIEKKATHNERGHNKMMNHDEAETRLAAKQRCRSSQRAAQRRLKIVCADSIDCKKTTGKAVPENRSILAV